MAHEPICIVHRPFHLAAKPDRVFAFEKEGGIWSRPSIDVTLRAERHLLCNFFVCAGFWVLSVRSPCLPRRRIDHTAEMEIPGRSIHNTVTVNAAGMQECWRHGGKSLWRLLLLIVRERAHPFSADRRGRILTPTRGGIRNTKRKQRSQARDTGYQMPTSLHGKNASQGKRESGFDRCWNDSTQCLS
jgi:hypothetical protein